MTKQLTLLLTAILILSSNPVLHAEPPANPFENLPAFMNEQQIAVWKLALVSDKVGTSDLPGFCTVFFTGKPLVSEACGYVFKYRTYNPFINRWITSNPKIPADGSNNLAYGGSPVAAFDPDGLAFISIIGNLNHLRANNHKSEVLALNSPSGL